MYIFVLLEYSNILLWQLRYEDTNLRRRENIYILSQLTKLIYSFTRYMSIKRVQLIEAFLFQENYRVNGNNNVIHTKVSSNMKRTCMYPKNSVIIK